MYQDERSSRTGVDLNFVDAGLGAPPIAGGRTKLVQSLRGLSLAEQLEQVRPPAPERSAEQPVQRYPDVAEVTRDLRSGDDLLDMSVLELNRYVSSQADWHTSPDVDEAQRGQVRAVLAFVFESDANLAGCGPMRVQDLADTKLTADVLAALGTYANSVRQVSPTVEISPTSSVSDAILWGGELSKLEGMPGGVVINHIMPQRYLEYLVSYGVVDDFINYCTVCEPVLQARPDEIESYLSLRVDESQDPVDYYGSLRFVRNYHRFHKTALNALVTNFSYTAKDKPLTLILHSALDHNGAFHRTAGLRDLILDARNLVLMIEGAETLDAIAGHIGPLVAKYGQNDCIDQVVIAGHGGPRSIELAGTVVESEGALPPDEENLDLDEHRQRTEEFLTEVLSHMGVDAASAPNRRIVFRACLTAANEVDEALDPNDPDVAAKQIRNAIDTNPSLATFLATLIGESGGDISSLGASGSYSGPAMMDPATGAIDLVVADDPALTSDKIDYVEFGIDPKGVMYAVVECWGDEAGPQNCLNAMRRRVANTPSSWDETVIHTVFQIVLTRYKLDAQMINSLVQPAYRLGKLESSSRTKIQHGFTHRLYDALPSAEVDALMAPLTSHASWSGHVPLVAYQVWAGFDDGHLAEFMAELGSGSWNCRSAREYVDLRFLGRISAGAALLPESDASTPTVAQMILALLGVLHNLASPSELCASFLTAVLGTDDRFDPGLDVSGLLDGRATEDEVLRAIGRGSESAQEATGPPNANVDLDGDGVNDFRIEPMIAQGVVNVSDHLIVSARPRTDEDRVGRLDPNDKVQIIGHYRNRWYAIVWDAAPGGTGFVYHRYVDV